MIFKSVDRVSPVYLDWIRRQPCTFGTEACGQSQAHHYPPKGRLGFCDDLQTIPVCSREHSRCHGIVIAEGRTRLQPIDEARQHIAVLSTFFRFWQSATATEILAVANDCAERQRKRTWVP